MSSRDAWLADVRAALRADQRLRTAFRPRRIEVTDDATVTIEAEAETVAIKRRVLSCIARVPGVVGIVDRISVTPAGEMSDDGMLDHLRKAYLQEPAFRGYKLSEHADGATRLVRQGLPGASGEIEFEVADGIVTLNGATHALASRRLAGVLAWWVPGSRDVINAMAVEPPEEDAPIRIEEAVRIALEKDPLVNDTRIRVGVRGRTVRLTGLAASDWERDAAEWDAWYVLGVDEVVNDVRVGP